MDHCEHGHPYSKTNTSIFLNKKGTVIKRCKKCSNAKVDKRKKGRK